MRNRTRQMVSRDFLYCLCYSLTLNYFSLLASAQSADALQEDSLYDDVSVHEEQVIEEAIDEEQNQPILRQEITTENLELLRSSQLNDNPRNSIIISNRDPNKKLDIDHVASSIMHIYDDVSNEIKGCCIRMTSNNVFTLTEASKCEGTDEDDSNYLLISVFDNDCWKLDYRDLSILIQFLKSAALFGYNPDLYQISTVNDNSLYSFSTFISRDHFKEERLLSNIRRHNDICTSKWRKEEWIADDGYDVDFKVDLVSACYLYLKRFQLSIGGPVVELGLPVVNPAAIN